MLLAPGPVHALLFHSYSPLYSALLDTLLCTLTMKTHGPWLNRIHVALAHWFVAPAPGPADRF